MSVNARVQATSVIYRLIWEAVTPTIVRRKISIINKVNPGIITRIIEEVATAHLIGILIIGESSFHSSAIDLFRKRPRFHHLFYFVGIIIVVPTSTNVTIIRHAATSKEDAAEETITIIISRATTTTTVIRTETRLSAEVEIGIIAVVRVPSRAAVDLIRASAINPTSSRRIKKVLKSHRKMNQQSIIVGRSHHSSSKTTTIDRVGSEASGVIAEEMSTTPFHCHVTNASSWSCSVQQTRASILASTKTFPWRRRAMKYQHTLHRSRTLSWRTLSVRTSKWRVTTNQHRYKSMPSL